eukprot:m.77129 g.77129  ORF g.77129 m.77129 type:complete len:597 (-) comp14537_c1_seq3:236-2026(-)
MPFDPHDVEAGTINKLCRELRKLLLNAAAASDVGVDQLVRLSASGWADFSSIVAHRKTFRKTSERAPDDEHQGPVVVLQQLLAASKLGASFQWKIIKPGESLDEDDAGDLEIDESPGDGRGRVFVRLPEHEPELTASGETSKSGASEREPQFLLPIGRRNLTELSASNLRDQDTVALGRTIESCGLQKARPTLFVMWHDVLELRGHLNQALCQTVCGLHDLAAKPGQGGGSSGNGGSGGGDSSERPNNNAAQVAVIVWAHGSGSLAETQAGVLRVLADHDITDVPVFVGRGSIFGPSLLVDEAVRGLGSRCVLLTTRRAFATFDQRRRKQALQGWGLTLRDDADTAFYFDRVRKGDVAGTTLGLKVATVRAKEAVKAWRDFKKGGVTVNDSFSSATFVVVDSKDECNGAKDGTAGEPLVTHLADENFLHLRTTSGRAADRLAAMLVSGRLTAGATRIEATALGILPQVVQQYVRGLLEPLKAPTRRDLLVPLKANRPTLSALTANHTAAQSAILVGLEYVADVHAEMLAGFGHACKLLYDLDMVEEPAFLSWSKEMSMVGTSLSSDANHSTDCHAKARPFVQWLEEAESDEDSAEE